MLETEKMPELEKMSVKQLEDMSQKALELAQSKKAEERKALRAALVEQIHGAGYTVDEIFPGAATLKQKAPASSPAEAKYQNPDDPAQTWSARGRKPKWLVQKEAAGHSLAEFEIRRA